MHEVIIIGSGPAGYTAGIYTSRAQLNPLVVAGEISGGQLMNTTLVENWPGNSQGIMGPELMEQMRIQTEKFGANIIFKNVTKVDLNSESKQIWIDDKEFQAKAVIVATGAKSKMLGVPGEDILLGRGVATCAVCDAAFYKGKQTIVVGGGDAAIEDALALTKFANHVTMLVRGKAFRASKIMQERALSNEKITVKFETQILEIKGDKKVESVVLKDVDGTGSEFPVDGVFIAIGHEPVTGLFKDQLQLDEKGYIRTYLNGLKDNSTSNPDLQSIWLTSFPTQTSVPGVFAAGDVVDFRYRQAITSAGMGCMAALDAERYLTGHIPSY